MTHELMFPRSGICELFNHEKRGNRGPICSEYTALRNGHTISKSILSTQQPKIPRNSSLRARQFTRQRLIDHRSGRQLRRRDGIPSPPQRKRGLNIPGASTGIFATSPLLPHPTRSEAWTFHPSARSVGNLSEFRGKAAGYQAIAEERARHRTKAKWASGII